ncbi:hypothetical protein V8G54_022199 [Vigna mungo]|uniref:PPM-type phosphatase domain-containing protein n=1 Tax=Vigna mungo TaxID=3915 RepID=A0AAQ3RXL8_VIGMU
MGSCFSAESRSPHPTSPSTSFRKHKSNAKKRLGSRTSSFEYWRNEPLHRIPGRIFLNGSSQVASLFTQQGKKGTNQDAMVVWENFCSRQDTTFCGVFDGHGPYGHMVAKRVRDSLPLKLNAHWEVNVPGEEVLKEISVNAAGSMNIQEAASASADEDSRIWDVLSNKEVVDIVAATSRRASAARALVESAVRAWRYKYPTSKVDDCAVVCLFLDSASHKVCSASIAKSKEQPGSAVQVHNGHNGDRGDVSAPTGLARSGTCRESDESDDTNKNEEEKETREEEIDPESEIEWSALEGVSRVNTLLNLPRFEPEKEDKGMRKQN